MLFRSVRFTTVKVVNLTNRQVLQHVFADVSRRQVMAELRARHAGSMDFGKASGVIKALLG